MSKEIIIDGIDVSECHRLNTWHYERGRYDCPFCLTHFEQWGGFEMFCNQRPDCYYKQLKRLEKENEELKDKVERLDKITGIFSARLAKKYKQDLEEIREIMENIKGTNTALYMNNTIIDNTARQSIELQARFISNLYRVLESEGE